MHRGKFWRNTPASWGSVGATPRCKGPTLSLSVVCFERLQVFGQERQDDTPVVARIVSLQIGMCCALDRPEALRLGRGVEQGLRFNERSSVIGSAGCNKDRSRRRPDPVDGPQFVRSHAEYGRQ